MALYENVSIYQIVFFAELLPQVKWVTKDVGHIITAPLFRMVSFGSNPISVFPYLKSVLLLHLYYIFSSRKFYGLTIKKLFHKNVVN